MSDDDLMETVKQIEKSENVIAPTLLTTHVMPFDVFKATREWQSFSTRKSMKSPHIYQFNPIRSSEAMNELSKKRWVSPICTLLIFLCGTPKKKFPLSASNYERTNISLIFQHPGVFKG